MGHIGSEIYPAPHYIGTSDTVSEINKARVWSSLYYSVCVQVKNKWSYTSTPHYVFGV
jgi:hypothetical protein